jgi:hypothetical protein
MRERSTYLNELNVRKPLVEYISRRSEELKCYSLIQDLTIWKPGSKRYLQIHLLAEQLAFWGVMIGIFWETRQMASMYPVNSPISFLSSYSITYGVRGLPCATMEVIYCRSCGFWRIVLHRVKSTFLFVFLTKCNECMNLPVPTFVFLACQFPLWCCWCRCGRWALSRGVAWASLLK